MEEKGIEEIFKSAFDKFEADVDPQVWTNVQQAINTPASVPSGQATSGSIAGKSGAIVAKMGIKTLITVITAITGVSIGTYFLISDSHNKQTPPATVTTSSAPQVTHQANQPVPTAPIAGDNNLAIGEHTSPAAKQAGKDNTPVIHSEALPINPGTASKTETAPAKEAKGVTNPAPVVAPPPAVTKAPPASYPPATAPSGDHSKMTPDEAGATNNHTYQDGFADINNYLETDQFSGKKGLPNVFSPNGDGRNDVFTIKTKNLKSLTVKVFDLSGRQVYEWNGLEGGWDGNLADGSTAPVGNYYYSLSAETLDGKVCVASNLIMLRR